MATSASKDVEAELVLAGVPSDLARLLSLADLRGGAIAPGRLDAIREEAVVRMRDGSLLEIGRTSWIGADKEVVWWGNRMLSLMIALPTTVRLQPWAVDTFRAVGDEEFLAAMNEQASKMYLGLEETP